MSVTIETINQLVEPVVKALGYELWGSELNSGGKSVLLRIYIDRSEGVSIDDCATISRQISAIMDVEEPIKGAYHLEVSSPGMDRGLFKPAHYEQYVGETVKLRLRIPRGEQRKFMGVLQAVQSDQITLALENGESIELPFVNIDKAQIIPKF